MAATWPSPPRQEPTTSSLRSSFHSGWAAAVVGGREEGEPPVAQRALVGREVGELGGGDRAARDGRGAPDGRDRRHLAVLAAPGADDRVVEVELPLGVRGGGLLGDVGVRG